MMEENASQNNQENAGRNPESNAPTSRITAEIKAPQAVVSDQQARTQPTGNPGADQPNQSEEPLGQFERRLLIVTWVAVVVAAITGAGIFSQFLVMSDQTKILSAQTISGIAATIESERNTREQLRIANEQAGAAHKSVEALEKQVRIARENLVDSQQPFVWIVGKQPDDDHKVGIVVMSVGEKAQWNFNYANFGKSPAIGLLVKTQVVLASRNGFAKLDEDIFKNIHKSTDITSGMILPPKIKSSWSTSLSKDILAPGDPELIQAAEGGIALFVHFEYFDSYGNRYHSEVCEFRLANGRMAKCDTHQGFQRDHTQ